MPCCCSSRITFPWFGAVVVSSADIATMSGLRVLISSTNRSILTLTPRSTTEKPFAESMVQTIRLPMSWMSPCTVQARTFPWLSRASFPLASSGSRIARAAFIASALMTSSGRNSSPAPNRSPTTRIPFTKPLSIDSSGLIPSSRDCLASVVASSDSPMMMQLAILSNSSWLLTSCPSLLRGRGSECGARRQELGLRRPERRRTVIAEAGGDLGAGFQAGADQGRELIGCQPGVGTGDADRGDGVAVPAADRHRQRDEVILELTEGDGVTLLANLQQIASEHLGEIGRAH